MCADSGSGSRSRASRGIERTQALRPFCSPGGSGVGVLLYSQLALLPELDHPWIPRMPHIFDNIDQALLPALRNTLEDASHADFCVGYFHLRGWGALADLVERFEGSEESCCRLLVGMHRPPEEITRGTQRAIQQEELLDGPTVTRRLRLQYYLPQARPTNRSRPLHQAEQRHGEP